MHVAPADTDAEGCVRAYLEALRWRRPRRGRPRSPDRLQAELKQVERTLVKIKDTGDPIEVLELTQRRLDLVAQVEAVQRQAEFVELETHFLTVVAPYSHERGISYTAWRELGVPASVLRRAGLR